MTDFISGAMLGGGNVVANTITATSIVTSGAFTISSTGNLTVAGNLVVSGGASGMATSGKSIAMNLIFGSG